MHWIFEPGFFANEPVRQALLAGAVVAIVSALVGVITVIRGQSFAGHAVGDVGTMGGSGAYLVGVSPLWGFVSVGLVSAGVMELFGVRRARGRDVATGIVLGAALGLSALFLYWDTTTQSTTGAAVTILFGSLFTIGGATVPAMVVLSAAGLLAVGVLYRPLLISSVDPDMAAALGVPVRTVGISFLCLMAVSASLCSVAVGAILSTALLIGPGATALRLTRRPGYAMAVAAALGLAATWLGILMAYDSYYWPPIHHGWPVSFFVVALVFCFYLASGAVSAVARRREPGRRLAEEAPCSHR